MTMKTHTKIDKKASADPTFPPLVPVTRGEIAEGDRNTSSSSYRVTRSSSRELSSSFQSQADSHYSQFSSGVANPGLASSVTASSSRHSSPTPPTSVSDFSRASSVTTYSSLPTIQESPKVGSITDVNSGLRRSARTRSRAASTQLHQEPQTEVTPNSPKPPKPIKSAKGSKVSKKSQPSKKLEELKVEVPPEPVQAPKDLAPSKDPEPFRYADPFEIFGPSKKKAVSRENADPDCAPSLSSDSEWSSEDAVPVEKAASPKEEKPPERAKAKSLLPHSSTFEWPSVPEREKLNSLRPHPSAPEWPPVDDSFEPRNPIFSRERSPSSETGFQNFFSEFDDEPPRQTIFGEDEVSRLLRIVTGQPPLKLPEQSYEHLQSSPFAESPKEDSRASQQSPAAESSERGSRSPLKRLRVEPENISQAPPKRSRVEFSRDVSTGISRAESLADSDSESLGDSDSDSLPDYPEAPKRDCLVPKSRLTHSKKEDDRHNTDAHISFPLTSFVAQKKLDTVPKVRSSLREVETISSETDITSNTSTRVNKRHQDFTMSEAEKAAYDAFSQSLGLARPDRLAEPTAWYSRPTTGINGMNGTQNVPTGSVGTDKIDTQPLTTLYPIPSTIEERYDPPETMVCLNCDTRIARDKIERHLTSCVAGNESDEETRSSLSEPPMSPSTSRRRSMHLSNLQNLPGPYDDDASDSESVSSADDTNAAEILLNMKFHKITKVEKFAQSLQNMEQMDNDTLSARLHNVQRAMETYQDEWIALERMTAKAAAGDGIPVLRNPRKVRDYHQYQDRLEADVYGYEHDPHHSKVGMQDPLAQRDGGRGVNGRNLRHRMPTQKAAEADLSASPESMTTEENGRRLTRSRYGSSRPNSQSREETPNPVPTFPSGKRKGRPPKNASRVEELRASKSTHPASRKNTTNSPSALSKYETPDGSEDDTEPDDMESSPRKQQKGRKGGKVVDVREAVRRAQSSKAVDTVDSNDDDYASIPADESRPTSSSSGRVTRSPSVRTNLAMSDPRKRKSAEPDDLNRPAKKPRGRRPKQAQVVEEDETDSNAVDTGADDTDATSGKTKKGGKPKSTHLSNVQKGKWAEDDGTRKAKQSTSMKLRWAKHAVLKKYGHNQGNTLTGVHANMVMPTPEMQAEVEELIKAELAKAELEYADKSAQSQAAPSPTASFQNMQSTPHNVVGSSRPTPQQSVDPEQNAAQPAAKPRPKKMVTLADGTVVTAQSKVMRDRWEKKRAAIAAGLPVPQIGRYPAGSQANSASATPRAASQSASSVAASRKPTPDSNSAAAANLAASEDPAAASEPKKAGKGKRKRKEEPVDEPTAAEVLESVEQAAAPPTKKSRGGRPPKASNFADEVTAPGAAGSQAPASSAATGSEASATSSRTKRAPKPKVPFGEETPILPPGTTLPASSGKRKRAEETPILPPAAAASVPKKKLGRPRKNTQPEDAPPEEIGSAGKRRKTSSATSVTRGDGTPLNAEQSGPASGSGTNSAVRKSSRPRRQRNLGLDGADDSSDEEQPRKMSEYEQFLALTSPALNSPLGPRGKRPAALRASTSFVLPDTSSEVEEDEEEDMGEESPREEQTTEGEGLQQELARQFKSEYDQFQAISSPGANIVLGKRNRKSVLNFGDVKREGSGSQGSQSPFRN